jgi:RNA polymerase sigma-70 factor (ECF subfamily)
MALTYFYTIFAYIYISRDSLAQFKNIFENNKKWVFNLALQYVQNQEDAEEIVQDVFVSVYENYTKFNENAKLSTWIYRITINKSLDYIKQKNAKKRKGFFVSIFGSHEGEEYKLDFPEFNHPGIQLEDKEQLAIFFDKINRLPENQKTAIILSKIEDKSMKEVAEIMEISIKALESLIQRAKTNLLKKS